MFGTLQLNPPHHYPGPIFVERADGAAFNALGSTVPQHMACDQCRQKKLRCTGRKSGCGRCKANSVDCTYTQIPAGNGRRRRGRKQPTSERGHAWSRSHGASVPSPSPSAAEDQGVNVQPSTIIAGTPNSKLAPVTAGGLEHTHGATASPRAGTPPARLSLGQIEIPANFPEEQSRSDGQNGGLEGWDEEFLMFDLDTAIPTRRGFDTEDQTTSDTHLTNPDFHWELYDAALTGGPSPQLDVMHPDSLLEGPQSNPSHPSTATTCVPPSRTAGGNDSSSACANQCLQLMKSLLEETDACLHDIGPCQVDAALSYQKRACTQCSQMIRRCKRCHADPDCMMFLTLICDKLVMLNKKILWYTTMEAVPGNISVLKRPLFAGQYEMDELDEWGGMVQHLSGVQLRRIRMLVGDIESSPGVEGREAHRIMLRSVKGQVGVLLARIGRALSKDVDAAEI